MPKCVEKILIVSIVALLSILQLTGCSHKLLPGEEKLVETSGKKKDWVKAESRNFKEGEMLCFRGQACRVADLSLGIRQAEADAKKRLIGKITESVQAEYSEYATSTNASDKVAYISDGIAWTSNRVRIAGMEPSRTYWEKIAVTGPNGLNYFYNVYTLLQISENDYSGAREDNLTRTRQTDRLGEYQKAENQAAKMKEMLRD